MALDRTSLDLSSLSPAAQRALVPGPARMMAARGLAPLPRPGELISVLYQLAIDRDSAIAGAAAQSAAKLPERVLAGALADEAVDPRVLDYFAEIVGQRRALAQLVVLNRATADATIAELAARVDAAVVDLIAQNEERLLRHPEIVNAMFHNPRARMSTVDRAVELAIRNGVKVPGIPAWDELCAAFAGKVRDPNAGRPVRDADALFEKAAKVANRANADGAGPEDADDDEQPQGARDELIPISELTVPGKIRLAALGNAFQRSVLIRDPIRMVAMSAIKSPGVSEMEAAKYASNHSLSDDVIGYIAGRREWTKLYGIKLALVQNPKTPIQASVRLMPHIRERDLRQLSRSKNIPSAVNAQARKLLMARKRVDRR